MTYRLGGLCWSINFNENVVSDGKYLIRMLVFALHFFVLLICLQFQHDLRVLKTGVMGKKMIVKSI